MGQVLKCLFYLIGAMFKNKRFCGFDFHNPSLQCYFYLSFVFCSVEIIVLFNFSVVYEYIENALYNNL